MLIGVMLPDGHPWRADVESLGSVVWDGDPAGLGPAALTALDVLLVDAAVLAMEDVIALRRFRVQRPETRIVVSLPAGTEPGSPVLAGLVALGVYDLATAETPLVDVVARHATYADGARWGLPPEDHAGSVRPDAPAAKEVVREKRVATSSRPVLVSVYGTLPAVGASSVAAELTRRLQARGHSACFWSKSGDKPEGVPTEWGDDPGTLLRSREHEYIVADHGLASEADDYHLDSDLVVLVLPGVLARARRDGIVPVWWPLPGAPRIAVAGPGPDSQPVAEAWSRESLSEAVAWPARPKRAASLWDQVLTPVLPDRSPGRWRKPKVPAPARQQPMPPSPAGDPQGPPRPLRVRLVGGGYGASPMTFRALWSWVMAVIDTALLVGTAGLFVYLAGLAAHAGVLHGQAAVWAEQGQGLVQAILLRFRR